MKKNAHVDCPRPYQLGKRLEASQRSRGAVLQAARQALENRGWANFTMEALAREGGVSRQTVHNLFGTKTGVLEALFDQLAREGGLGRMPQLMQQAGGESVLQEFVKIFTEFWASHRLLIRRIHAVAALDEEFAVVVNARNQRRKGAARRVMDRCRPNFTEATRAEKSIVLYAMTSFEFFDVLFGEAVGAEEAWPSLWQLVQQAVNHDPTQS